MRFFVPLGFILALAGCADSHNWAPQQNGSARIAASDRILISTPQMVSMGHTSTTVLAETLRRSSITPPVPNHDWCELVE